MGAPFFRGLTEIAGESIIEVNDRLSQQADNVLFLLLQEKYQKKQS